MRELPSPDEFGVSAGQKQFCIPNDHGLVIWI